MTQFFEIDFIVAATKRLNAVGSKGILIPLVLGANGVGASVVNITERLGSDKYLDRFFAGDLLGLEPKKAGNVCTVRPLFSDLEPDGAEHIAKKADGKLWANNYSQSGYAKLRDNGTLQRTTGSVFGLGGGFAAWHRSEVPTEFNFEDLLTWLYAFSGFGDDIDSWAKLASDFSAHHTFGGAGFPVEYQGVFALSGHVPWPSTLLTERPTNREFQDALLPGTSSSEIDSADFLKVHDELRKLIATEFLGYGPAEQARLAASIVSSLQSCKRLFILGDPGTGKSELASLITSAFDNVFGDRVHTVSTTISDGSSSDKLIGFSTLDGEWVDGILTEPDEGTGKTLLSELEGSPKSLAIGKRRQINFVVLDEANRRDIEDLLSRFQVALDSDTANPEHVSCRIKLDNSGEKYLSPNTFLVMTGNSPREDSGRVVQSRPFKRRHNLLALPNVFERALQKPSSDFRQAMAELWDKRGTGFSMSAVKAAEFRVLLLSQADPLLALQNLLTALEGYSIGVSYGLAKKLLKAAGARFALTGDFSESLDLGLTDSLLPLLATEVVLENKSIRDRINERSAGFGAAFPNFVGSTTALLRGPDNFGRVRAFL